jgi:hypothetical protein
MDLLRLWRTVYQEAVQLVEAVEQLPDECECRDADAHLAGRCPCCGLRDRPGSQGRPRKDCHGILARLRADLAMLTQDLSVAGPSLEAAALEGQRFELRREVFLAASGLQGVVESFGRATDAVAGFRRECTVSRMQAVKRACAGLRDHCERVNVELQRPLA